MQKIPCPCCGREVNHKDLPIESLLEIKLTDIETEIIDKLITDYPKKTKREDLINFVYAFDPNGGPGGNSFDVIFSRAKKKVINAGWKIINVSGQKSGRGNKATYKLMRI